MKKNKLFSLPDLGLVYTAAIWGSAFFIIKIILTDINPVVLVGYRYLTAAILLGIYLLFKRKNLLQNLKQGIILGGILWCIDTPQFIGLKFTSSVNSGFITGLFLFFVPILSYIFFKKLPNRIQIVALFISVIGLWFLSNGLRAVNIGDAITLITPIAYAIHIVIANKYIKNHAEMLVLAFQEFAVVGILGIIVAALFHLPFGIKHGSTIAIILFLAIFANTFANVIFLAAQKYISTIRAGFILSLEPVFAAIFAWTIGHEAFYINQLFGGALIFLAMIVSQIQVKSENI